MTPRIENLPEKKLVGQRIRMSLASNRTGELWRNFMPRRSEVKTISANLFSMQVFDQSTDVGNISKEFEKWAAMEVANFNAVPTGMECFVMPTGLYAVFFYKGLSTDIRIFQDIFGVWLPSSGYELDNRPHFELLGEKYKNNDPNSEEEIWVPIKPN
jgi:AraC family transcriptional regulator